MSTFQLRALVSCIWAVHKNTAKSRASPSKMRCLYASTGA